LFINLTPFIPLSLKGEGEEILERGFAPLLLTLPLPLLREGGQGDRLLNNIWNNEFYPFFEIASGLRPSQRQKGLSLRAEGVAIS